jgi:hypothetical protein
MRCALTLLGIIAWAVLPSAQAQTAAPPPGGNQQGESRPASPSAAAAAGAAKAAHPAKPSSGRRSRARPGGAQRPAPAAHGDGVLALGATDITGNKELPKVMVIVPWKDATGAGGVIKPTDSLMNEVLQPVDRGVFQRQIRYFGQLEGTGKAGTARAAVAPDGDNR